MDAQEYFTAIVMPTYREFEQERLDRRRALLAALVLYHLLDYVNADRGGNEGNLGALQKKTCERYGMFRLVKVIANGTKHAEVRGPDPFSPDAITAAAAGTVLDRRELEQGRIREHRATTPMLWCIFQGQRVFVDLALFATLQYLAREFGLRGADGLDLPMQLVYKDTPA